MAVIRKKLTCRQPQPMKFIFLAWLSFVSLSMHAFGQAPSQALIDSLLRVTKEAPQDTQKVEAFVYLVFHNRYQRDAGVSYAREGIILAKKANFTRGLYNLYNQLGVVYDIHSEYLPAIEAYKEGLDVALRAERSDWIGSLYTNMGLVYWNLGVFDEALALYIKALGQFEGNEKTIGYLASTYNNIGLIYSDKKEFSKAGPYFEKAIELIKTQNDSFNLAAFYNNMGNVSKDAGKQEEALEWFKQALNIHKALNNAYGLGMAWYNIASSYLALEKFGIAQEAGFNSLEARIIAGDRLGIALAHNLLAANFQSLEKLEKAIYHSNEALRLAEELGSNTLLHRVYRNRWLILKDANRTAEALEAHIRFKQYSDSLTLADADKRLREVEVRYEVDKKDREIAMGQASLRQKELTLLRRNQLIGALVAVLVLLVALGLVLRSRYRYKQQQRLAEANLQMQQAQIKAVISAQEAEKTRFAQDLHDGIGQLLTALKLSLNQTNADEPTKSQVLIDELYREMRHLAYNIMPQTLLKKGLVKAVEELTLRLNQAQNQILFELNVYGLEQRLPLESEQLLYRVIQEWLTNVMKYAQCSKVVLSLVAAEGNLSLMIEDNGHGFDPAVLGKSKGHGWANIESRLQVLGANYELDSRAGRQGTTLNIEISLNQQAA